MITRYARTKSTLSHKLPFVKIPVPPEIGFGPLTTSLPYLTKGNGFKGFFKRMQTIHNDLGPIVRIRFMPFTPYIVSTTDPDAVAQIYRQEGPMPQRFKKTIWELCLNTKTGKTSLNDHLLRPNNIPTWLSRIDAVAQDVATRIQNEAATNNGSITLNPIISAYTLESLSSIVFGKRMGCIGPDPNVPIDERAKQFTDAIHGFFTTSERIFYIPDNLPTWFYSCIPEYKKLVQHVKFVFDFGEEMVLEKIKANDSTGTDLLTLFLSRPELSEREAISQAIEVLLGGVDTTAIALLWLLYSIAAAPNSSEIQMKIRNEVNLATGSKKVIDEEALGKLTYIRACVKEALRLYPPTNAQMRTAVDDMTLLGYDIPKGSILVMSIYVMGRNSNIFENPDDFIPERWLERENKLNRSNAAYSTIPFSMCTCVGRRLAETEMYILLAHIVRNLDLQWPSTESLLQGELRTLLTPEKPLTISCQPVAK
ncbi:cytochrome P450, mitochondrial-like [Thraustotheca clavata]|uniref:Cytochrome P450, mitochondrial-like n=1 Tax=Thraustotheca clavata TaxID=74557 RepID=A0A1V9ZQP7_9STRA|nr:cytochrome P450, mitochondrial-like [Thraustotheca clavata]